MKKSKNQSFTVKKTVETSVEALHRKIRYEQQLLDSHVRKKQFGRKELRHLSGQPQSQSLVQFVLSERSSKETIRSQMVGLEPNELVLSGNAHPQLQ